MNISHSNREGSADTERRPFYLTKPESLILVALTLCILTGRCITLQNPPAIVENTSYQVWQVDVNTADVPELMLLDSIGPATASKIIEDRESFGLFQSVDDLLRVRGIGPKTLEKIRPNLKVSPVSSVGIKTISMVTSP